MCPVEQCFTLKKVVENEIFVSNTKIVLFPVLHVLSDDFDTTFISNVSNISFTCESTGGQASCHIQCRGSAGFFYHNVMNVSISDIFFENCGASASRYFKPMDQLYGASIVLLFRYSTNITFARVTVVGRMDYGIAMVGPQENVALINTTLKVPSQGVCFYAAMDNRLSLRPLWGGGGGGGGPGAHALQLAGKGGQCQSHAYPCCTRPDYEISHEISRISSCKFCFS